MADALVAVEDGIMTITLNRPEAMNAVSLEMSDTVAAAMEQADTDPGVHVVVITSSSTKAFCAGADLKATSQGQALFDADGPHGSWGLAGATRRTPAVPVIAAVEGLALGGGFEIALAADILIASTASSFGLPEVTVGLMAGAGGAVRLPGQLPPKVAMPMLLAGERLDAQRAYQLGLVSRLVEPGTVDAEAREMAQRIAAAAPLAVRGTKAVALNLQDGLQDGHRAAWARNDAEFAAVMASADATEGTTAFREKRRPVWTGA